MQGPVGWWIIKGVENEFYACEPAIFEKTYERIGGPVMQLCECCGYPREKLPFESRNGVVYCQVCWDVGCDLQTCDVR